MIRTTSTRQNQPKLQEVEEEPRHQMGHGWRHPEVRRWLLRALCHLVCSFHCRLFQLHRVHAPAEQHRWEQCRYSCFFVFFYGYSNKMSFIFSPELNIIMKVRSLVLSAFHEEKSLQCYITILVVLINLFHQYINSSIVYLNYGAEMGNSLNILKKSREVFPMKRVASRLYSSTVSNFLLAWCFIWPAFLENLKKKVGREIWFFYMNLVIVAV